MLIQFISLAAEVDAGRVDLLPWVLKQQTQINVGIEVIRDFTNVFHALSFRPLIFLIGKSQIWR